MDSGRRDVDLGRAAVNRALEAFLDSDRVKTSFAPLDHHIYEDFRNFVLGEGKRFRPMLAWAAWEGFGPGPVTDRQVVLGLGVALELFHTFLLIHDDIIDDADTRRGGATLRELFARRYPGRQGLKAFADHLALVVGDICFTLALEHLNDLTTPDPLRRRLVGELLRYARLTGVGQVLDVSSSAATPAGALDPKQIELCYELKTAQYTIECPLVLGALLAGANDGVFKELRRYARSLGVAYQISDDLVGVSRCHGEKSGTLDFERGRQTLLVALTVEAVEEEVQAWLMERFGQGPLSDEDAARLLDLYRTSGAVARLEARIASLRGDALAAARGFGEGVQRFEELVAQLLPEEG